jgi:acetylornithine deacetylase/succinyl-diaminopimelate desuccinylase-like protein
VKRQVAKLVAHIEAQGFHVLNREPTDDDRAVHDKLIRVDMKSGGYNAQRTPLDAPLAQLVVRTVQSTADDPIVVQPAMGGSVALSVIEETMGTQLVIVPVVNADNNQHAENENVKVQFLWEGIETYAALMTMR